MKPRLHFHSDCAAFSGCENMLVNFFANGSLRDSYEISFSYRASPAYESGFRERVSSPPCTSALPLLDVGDLTERLPNGPLRLAAKILANLLLARHVFTLWNTALLWREFGRRRPDVLHVNNGGWPGAYSCHAAVLAAALRGVRPVVYVVNNMAVPYGAPRRWLDWPLDRLVVRLVDAFIVANEPARERLAAVLNPKEIARIPNGIRPRSVGASAAEVRRGLGVPEGRPLVAVVSLLERWKGHAHLIEAAARLKSLGKTLPFIALEGEGPEKEPLAALIARHGLSDSIRLIGRHPAVFDLLAAADVVAEVSESSSPSPNVVAEAMSLGRPVLASVHSSSEQVENGVSGLLVDPRDEASLAQALACLLDDGNLRARLSEGARAAFDRTFRAETSVAAYRNLYDRLRGASPRALSS